MKLGLLFSGQGSQKPGMGLDFLSDPLFSELISAESAASKLNLRKIMASEDDELKETKNVQPALVAVSYDIYRMLQRDLPQMPVAAMAGLSLGEYGALMASNSLSADEGLPLLADRGQYMQDDADRIDSAMAAILNPDVSAVENVCDHYDQVWVANYNSPKQLVIGGVSDQVEQAAAELKEQQAAKRVVVLRVSGAFHTPLFNQAREKMHQRLQSVHFAEPTVPVISNTLVQPFAADDIATVMERQLAVPTHFGEDLQYMVDHERIDATLEIGLGKTLTRFAKQVAPTIAHDHISTLADYEKYVKEHPEWN
ncbi:ACP S-malonyltransferase [Limosilactobacillus sp.]|uniref:ACP S-malonyltransferase n=1 Tax=Limosilactobacillus sp. TaxID=2773925 RepID=UPI00345E304A